MTQEEAAKIYSTHKTGSGKKLSILLPPQPDETFCSLSSPLCSSRVKLSATRGSPCGNNGNRHLDKPEVSTLIRESLLLKVFSFVAQRNSSDSFPGCFLLQLRPCGDGMVEICHVPPGDPTEDPGILYPFQPRKLCLPEESVDSHLDQHPEDKNCGDGCLLCEDSQFSLSSSNKKQPRISVCWFYCFEFKLSVAMKLVYSIPMLYKKQ